ncbi:MAG: family 43 glycosylhydrolase [Clostridia bacterium]|nr:family 43 glycosylhydrolase [Clostridia bacterium]
MKLFGKIPLFLVIFGMLFSASCGKGNVETTETNPVPETEAEVPVIEDIVMAEKGGKTEFKLVYDVESEHALRYNILQIREAFDKKLDVDLRPLDDYQDEIPCEIIVGSERRQVCADLTATLKTGEYIIKALTTPEGNKRIVIAYKGAFARMEAIDRFITEYINNERAAVPGDLEVKGSCKEVNALITSTIPQLRDPCIVLADGVYYAYGTGWRCWKNDTGSLKGGWKDIGVVAKTPPTAVGDHWAPEVHYYNGAYYMFTTYRSSVNDHRGCTIMKSEKPEGPFVEITNGHITPDDWDAIDGTFYVDEDGQPWMIFVHEWTSTDDSIGRMAAAKLSDDLTEFISEPIELFRADDPSWSKNGVTDGCWMYKCENGELLMIWSNWDSAGYCVGIARSDNGKVDGKWSQDKALLYSKAMTGTWDGGHGMIFKDKKGQMYLSVHSPNSGTDTRKETPVFVPIKERDGTLVWDLWQSEE